MPRFRDHDRDYPANWPFSDNRETARPHPGAPPWCGCHEQADESYFRDHADELAALGLVPGREIGGPWPKRPESSPAPAVGVIVVPPAPAPPTPAPTAAPAASSPITASEICRDCDAVITRYAPDGVGFCDRHGRAPEL
jgi:hypothetical protein